MPYWRLSGFYFFYFATLGAIVPYFGIYLRSIGFDATQIGELMAIIMFSRIIAPTIWGWIADHQNQRMNLVRLAALLSTIVFAGVFVSTRFWWLALVMLAFSFFWNATLPQVEAATMSHLGGKASQYARVRLWGSLGFIIAVVGLGSLFDYVNPWWLLPIITFLLGMIWISSMLVPDRDIRVEGEHHEPLIKVLFRPDVFAFLFACFLMQASHGPYYTFYTIYLSDFGYSKTLIGWLWAVGVICEIGVFVILHKVQRRLSLRWIMLGSCVLASVRWLLIAYFPHQLSILLLAQVLHAVTFGAYHAAAIETVHNFFRGKHQTRGQAIYGSLSFGLGGALGSVYAGYTWDSGGETAFIFAALLAAAASLVVWRWVHSNATY